jgi:hypothetical protein
MDGEPDNPPFEVPPAPTPPQALNPKAVTIKPTSTYCKEVFQFPDIAVSAQVPLSIIGTLYQ